MSASTYPVRVDARLDPQLSRGLWLVKWLLVLPHYVVLAFLWLAFVVLSVVAFFAILFTGRYPRAVFEFNVGVLRWSWRVAYYAYGALATDRYPPFSLRERPDYPAHLHVDYPEHLSRGLVLVKWWLLAIPHYLVIGFFLGGLYVANETVRTDPAPWLWGGGLIGLLALVAAVVLLFTGRYPQQIYDFVLGMNRWVLRVAGYSALMTDQYPPFRLDQGGDDPEAAQLTMLAPSGPPTTTATTTPTREGATAAAPRGGTTDHGVWTTGRVVSLVTGSVLLLVALGAGLAAATAAVAGTTMRDDGGFLMSGERSLSTDGYALTSENLELHAADAVAFVPRAVLGDAKITARSDGATPVFVGVAATSDVTAYLQGVRHATVVDMSTDVTYRTTGGGAPATAPTSSDIWVAQSAGTGAQTVVWPLGVGDWTVVVMNADGTPNVAAAVSAGLTVPALGANVGGLLSVAVIALVIALVLVVVPLRAAHKALPAAAFGQPTPAGTHGEQR
ncbi:MAG: DUF4389 domain-containing protein [Actinomycetes bacterium]